MAKGKKRLPSGWYEVPDAVVDGVDGAVASLALGLTLQGQDALGAGISPRVVRMARSLIQGNRLGPTTMEALRHMLRTANDNTFVLLGGEMTLQWAFAPSEFDALMNAVVQLPDGMTDEEIHEHPTVVQARERLDAALDDAFRTQEEDPG
jgi:hypothetical protein